MSCWSWAAVETRRCDIEVAAPNKVLLCSISAKCYTMALCSYYWKTTGIKTQLRTKCVQKNTEFGS